ncbi:MAG: hypothetical protein Ct9H300mP1_30620 [Planctomycetaceae bacterium]|nr:MAG: hypothetical protein Ct9H300mP1_30620 [Planctomycetaceae bacterium]
MTSPVGGCLAGEQRTEAQALHVGGDVRVGQVEKRLGEVQVADQVSVDAAGSDVPGPADHQRHPVALLVHEPLVEPSVVAQVEALVGGIDHDGVFGQTGLVEVIQDPADVVVDAGDAPEEILDVPLILPADQVLALELGFSECGVLGAVGGVPGLELFRSQFSEGEPVSGHSVSSCERSTCPVFEQRCLGRRSCRKGCRVRGS